VGILAGQRKTTEMSVNWQLGSRVRTTKMLVSEGGLSGGGSGRCVSPEGD
jgi:hypothetical protein